LRFVIARSAATRQSSANKQLDCHAALAMTKMLCLLIGLAVLASCGDDRPPAPTREESDQLNEAEKLLNEQAEAENSAG
jgi:hypothetical protein